MKDPKFCVECSLFRWVNNLMLKHRTDIDGANASMIENLIFIDFQYSCWTSPTIDLHYFLNNSLQESLRHERFHELIEFYHSNLVAALKQLEYKQTIPTFEQFMQQYLEKNFYGKKIFNEVFKLFFT